MRIKRIILINLLLISVILSGIGCTAGTPVVLQSASAVSVLANNSTSSATTNKLTVYQGNMNKKHMSEPTLQKYNGKVVEHTDLSYEDLNVKCTSDAYHSTSSKFILANNEGVLLTMTTSRTDITANDVFIIHDSGLKLDTHVINKTDETSTLHVYITNSTPGKSGNASIFIYTYNDYLSGTSTVPGYLVTLDWSSSQNSKISTTQAKEQVVYITITGERYHVQKTCVRKPIESTLSEAKSHGLTPCQKCSKGW